MTYRWDGTPYWFIINSYNLSLSVYITKCLCVIMLQKYEIIDQSLSDFPGI